MRLAGVGMGIGMGMGMGMVEGLKGGGGFTKERWICRSRDHRGGGS